MREVSGNIWDFACEMRVIPTNGFVKNNGNAVMGAGLAKQAARRYPDLPAVLGRCIEQSGNHVHVIRHDLIAFPTKHNWWEDSNLKLIGRSAQELLSLTDAMGYTTVALPRVGTGNGNLRWGLVKPVLESVFGDDERFIVVDDG